MWGGKRPTRARRAPRGRTELRNCVVAIATGQTPSPRYKPPRQSLSVRIKQEHLLLITSLQSSEEMMLGRGREIETEIWSKNTPKLESSGKCGTFNKAFPALSSTSCTHFHCATSSVPYGQHRFESLQTPRPWGGSHTAAPGKQANLASRPFAARRNGSELFEVSVSDKQQPQNLHEW